MTGKKHIALFSLGDAQHLYVSGCKSEVLNAGSPELDKSPPFPKVRNSLEAGDDLLTPALWFHTVISEEFVVGENSFQKHLPWERYDTTDTCGNRDPVATSRAVQILDRALKTLAELPEEYRDFYTCQMVSHIQDKAYSKRIKKRTKFSKKLKINKTQLKYLKTVTSINI
uniref:Cupin-like domain-containing protein n=1 Tax=Mus spicilegus TaxID=10103 RepID=A0A8C6HNZ5_MUSSI